MSPTMHKIQINYARLVVSKGDLGVWGAYYIQYGKLWWLPQPKQQKNFNGVIAVVRERYPEGSIRDASGWSEVTDPSVFRFRFFRMSTGQSIGLDEFPEELKYFGEGTEAVAASQPVKVENSAGHCEYYHCPVDRPQNPNQTEAYIANCEDIIQALGLTFDEGCEFKSLWRRARARQGYVKAESSAVRDARKAVHYAARVLSYEMSKEAK